MTTTSNTAERLTDVSDMYVVHRVFRREFVLIPQLVRQVAAGDTARAAVVGEHARLILLGLDIHHTGEDALLWPELLERDPPAAELDSPDGVPAPPGGRADRPARRNRSPAGRPKLGRRSGRRWPRPSTRSGSPCSSTSTTRRQRILPIAARCITQEGGTRWASTAPRDDQSPAAADVRRAAGGGAHRRSASSCWHRCPSRYAILLRTVFAWQYRRRITRVRTP